MARPVTAKFGKMKIEIGDGEDPEVFAAPCGFTSKALTLSKNLSEVSIPDCDDPDAPLWLGRDVQSLTASVTGDGVLAAESIETWQEFFDSTDSRTVRISIEFSTGTMQWVGLMHLETLNPSAESGGRIQMSVSMQSDGEMVGTWTAATP
ncbi:hypothetical protein CG51_17910 [Haematobacter missouriensis]|uniref:Phage tail protein n=1 Tax=Haematobacter missouriensis TaxID=366616 RepID=A0A212AI03_9RHOB|nr:phage tail tube protein [Haematobacter missouriensis]KFI24513.1 hypothetical protein CG51_17910 [Haematobacter missouriensis]OWJ70995.1 hypothetical protein CDV53_19815 [Haematobacter missouriensis]OWJ81079.1 hypothetical protein CDV52_19550 [Haematobacter missouriensis]